MKTKLTIFLFLIGILLPTLLNAQQDWLRLRVKTGTEKLNLFSTIDVFPAHGFLEKDGTFSGDFLRSDLWKLDAAGVKWEPVDQELMSKATTYHPCFVKPADYAVPSGFQTGSMGGFYTLAEAMAEIDTMIAQFPLLISNKYVAGTSWEGRPVYFLKISDNPSVQENEPQVLYTAVHHSQEPASLQQLIFFMYYLLENYGSDPLVTYLVDHTELYFMPVVNPDGYVYNQNQYPGGGGMHRKNRNTGLFSDGVDLNRNYGYAFGYDEFGSSSIGFHPWHRGDSAFSEPESRAVKNFMELHNVSIDVNWHSYGNMIIYPWNYENHYTPDFLLYENLAEAMTCRNLYRYGTVYETYGYQSNGDADDWLYGDTVVKPVSISLTAEAGNMDDGFWPEVSRIVPICLDALSANLAIACYAHAFYEFEDHSSQLTGMSSGHFPFEFRSTGLDSPAVFDLQFVPLSSNISFPAPNFHYSGMGINTTVNDSVAFLVTGQPGETIRFAVTVNNGLYTFSDTITKFFGLVNEIFHDDCETIMNWTGDDWGISPDDPFAGSYSITESPSGDYWIGQTSILELNQAINLETGLHAVLQFKLRYDLEHNYDYVSIELSTDNGTSWAPLCGRYSKVGTDDETEGQPLYHGAMNDWKPEEILLDDFTGQTVRLRFSFISDQSGVRNGFHFDELAVAIIDTSLSGSGKTALSGYPLVWFDKNREVIVVSGLHGNDQVVIFSEAGKIKYSNSTNIGRLEIPTGEWARGLYLCRITGSKISSEKVPVH